MFLTPEELETLTGKKTPAIQMKALELMGIAYKVNALGRVIVLRSNLEQNWEPKRRNRAQEPNWEAVR